MSIKSKEAMSHAHVTSLRNSRFFDSLNISALSFAHDFYNKTYLGGALSIILM